MNLLTTLALLLSLSIMAEAKPKTRLVNISVACTGALPGDTEVLTSKGTRIMLSKRHPSKPVQMELGPDHLCRLFSATPLAEGQEPRMIAKIKIPPSKSSGLVVLIVNQKHKRYRPVFFDNQDFALGTLSFFNTTDKVIAIKSDIGELVLRPNKKGKLKPNFNGKNVISGAKMAFKQKLSDDNWNVFYSSRWYVKATQKEMMILYRHPQTKKIRSMSLIEYKSAAE